MLNAELELQQRFLGQLEGENVEYVDSLEATGSSPIKVYSVLMLLGERSNIHFMCVSDEALKTNVLPGVYEVCA